MVTTNKKGLTMADVNRKDGTQELMNDGMLRWIDEGADYGDGDDGLTEDCDSRFEDRESREDIFDGYGECDPRFEDEDYAENPNRALDDEAREYFRQMDGVEDEPYDEDWGKVACTQCGDKYYPDELIRIPGYRDICSECAQDIADGKSGVVQRKCPPKMRFEGDGLARGKKPRNSKPPRREKDIVLED